MAGELVAVVAAWEFISLYGNRFTIPETLGRSPSLDFTSISDLQSIALATVVLTPLVLLVGLIVQRMQRRLAIMRGLAPRDALMAALKVSLGEMQPFRLEALRPALADLRRHRLVPAPCLRGLRSQQHVSCGSSTGRDRRSRNISCSWISRGEDDILGTQSPRPRRTAPPVIFTPLQVKHRRIARPTRRSR
jgi:hypothetical protein